MDNPLDDLSFYKRCALIIAVCCLALLSDGCSNDAEVTAALVSEADDRKALRPDQLSHPLGPCDFTMRVSAGYRVFENYCYRRKEEKCS